jgi:SET domain-containing protein
MSEKTVEKYNNTCSENYPASDTDTCYGCTKYIDVTNDARAMAPRDSRECQDAFKDRQAIEEHFAVLGDRKLEQRTL